MVNAKPTPIVLLPFDEEALIDLLEKIKRPQEYINMVVETRSTNPFMMKSNSSNLMKTVVNRNTFFIVKADVVPENIGEIPL